MERAPLGSNGADTLPTPGLEDLRISTAARMIGPPECVEPAWQFRLRHLLGLMTLASVAAAIAVAWSVSTLVASMGLIVAWLNWCGDFAPLHTNRRQRVLLWLAWATFLVSLALPSLVVFGPVFGGAAA